MSGVVPDPLAVALAGPAPQTGRLTKLLDTRPASLLSTLTSDPRGEWVFLAEGGALVWSDCRSIVSATNPFGAPPPANGDLPITKRLAIGLMGVRPAALHLHPDADLNAGGTGDKDWIFIAGGHRGLWAMHLDPSTGNVQNRVVRIDDSGNLNPASQLSRRYCNKLAIIEVGAARYLVAGFARHNASAVRFYELSALMTVLNGTSAGFGWVSPNHPVGSPGSRGEGVEIAAHYQVLVGGRAGMLSHPTAPQVYGGSWLQGLAVDVVHRGTPTAPQDILDVYLALDCHGLARVRLTEDAGNPNKFSLSALSWGPHFGDGSHYASTHSPRTYGNWGVRDLSRSHTYNELERNDPPHFLDVAVERRVVSGGAPDQVYVYAACDHLGWVRFALDSALTWNTTVTLDHHEGLPRDVERYPNWVVEAEKTNVLNPLVDFDKTQFEHDWDADAAVFVPVDQPPLTTAMPPSPDAAKDYAYARQLALVEPPPGATGIQGMVLVVTYSAQPSWIDCAPDAPWHTFGHIFDDIGGTSGTSMEHVRPGAGAYNVTAVFDTGALLADPSSALGYLQDGGVIHVPPDQTVTPQGNSVRIVHSAGGIPGSIPGQSYHTLTQGCLTYFRFNTPFPMGEPYFLRPIDTNYGKRTNGVGWTILDDEVLVTADNDGGFLEHEGVLRTRMVGTRPEFEVLSAAVPGTADERLQVGLTVPHESQFVPPTGELVTTGYGRGVGWNFRSHTVTFGGGALTSVNLNFSRGITQPFDRWVRRGRDAYSTVSNTRGDYDAWVTSLHFSNLFWGTQPGEEPPWGNPNTGLVFLSTGATVDGLTIARRDNLWHDWIAPGSGSIVTWPPTETPGLNAFAFNTHPEWNGMPFRAQLDFGSTTNPLPSQSTCEDEIASAAWLESAPYRELALCLTWAPEVVRVPTPIGPVPDRWFIAVPCHTLTRSTAVESFLTTKNPFGVVDEVDYNNVGSGGGAALPCNDMGMSLGQSGAGETAVAGHVISSHLGSAAWRNSSAPELTTFYTHGLVQFWEITDPRSDAGSAGALQVLDGLYQHGNPRPGMRIILPAPQSAAFKVRVADLPLAGKRLLFVDDFAGRIYVYDVTAIADVEDGFATFPGAIPPPIGPASGWPLSWTAPSRLSDALPIANVRAMDIEVFDSATDPRVDVYVGVPEAGIYVLTFKRSGPSGGPYSWGFDASQEQFIETPGDVHDLKVRPATLSGVPRTLLVSDGPAGFRMYGEQL